MHNTTFAKSAAMGLAVLFALGTTGPISAQTTHHKGFLRRHRNLTSAAAGYGAYRYAKSRRHGIMHRHPYLTGAAAAALTHHHLKHH